EARKRGKKALFVPAANAQEAAMVKGIAVYGVRNLRETFSFLCGECPLQPTRGDLEKFFATHQSYEVDFADVKGQAHVKRALEVMRQPLEDGRVTVSRAAGSVTFPSEFMLVAAMNPCPCGYFGDLKRECRCGPNQVQRYRQRISGPLLDRIDLHIEVLSIEYRDMASERSEEPSSAIRE